MTIARNHHLFINEPTYFHLISRCVRRAYLCGKDKHSGKRYDHRKQWLEKRLFDLTELFFVDLYGYAIMSNHYHLLLCTRPDDMLLATDEQIAQRWCRLFPHRHLPDNIRVQLLCQEPTKIALYRQRLCDISWLMRCLNEQLARKANKEDECTGRFWQGRFRSQLLLNEAAIYTCMAYIDLNPVRAGVASTPQLSEYTSIYYRLAHHSNEDRLRPLSNSTEKLPLRLSEYLSLVCESAKSIQNDYKGETEVVLQSILEQLAINPLGYMSTIQHLSKHFYRGIGSIKQLEHLAQRLNLKWVKGQSASRCLFG